MSAAEQRPDRLAVLPQLSGGLLGAYRAAWALLALLAVASLGYAVFEPSSNAIVVGLRLAKGITVLTVAAILFRKRQRDPVAALLCLALLSWTLSSSVDFASAPVLPLLLDRLRFLLFVLALLFFPDGSWEPRWTRSVAAASAAVFVVGLVETIGLTGTALFLPLAIGCVLAAVAALILRFRKSQSEILRQQLRWVALGLVSGIALILSARAGSAVTQGSGAPFQILWEALFQLGIVVIALGFLVSLLRYRLYDADAVISRSAVYGVLTICLVMCFAGSEGLIEVLGQRYLGSGVGDFSAAFAAAFAAVLLAPLHSRIDAWAERHFQRDLMLLKREVPALAAELTATGSPREIAQLVLPRINEALHVSKSALVFNGTIVGATGASRKAVRHAVAEPSRDAALFPFRIEFSPRHRGGTALLLIGPRPDSSSIGKDEIEALESILPALRLSLATTSAREAERKTFNAALDSLRQRIERLPPAADWLNMCAQEVSSPRLDSKPQL